MSAHFNGYAGQEENTILIPTLLWTRRRPRSFEGYWAEFLDLDNNDWHHSHSNRWHSSSVWINATNEEDTPLIGRWCPDSRSRGLVLSAGTGAVGSHHRIDNLQINAACDN